MLRRWYDTDYKMEKDVVKNFLGAPFQITGARDEGDTAVNRHHNWVSLLHILLMKHKEKKAHLLNAYSCGLDNALRICKRLKLEQHNHWEQLDTEFNEIIPKVRKRTVKMHEKMAECVVNLARRDYHEIVCSMDKEFLVEITREKMDHKKLGEIDGIPNCCIDAFVENRWDIFEINALMLGKPIAQNRTTQQPNFSSNINRTTYTTPEEDEEFISRKARELGLPTQMIEDADFIIINTFNPGLGDESFEKQKDDSESIATGVRTYPFLTHIPCEDCIRNFENSPSAIMNNRFSDFCKFRFPELYEAIIADASTYS